MRGILGCWSGPAPLFMRAALKCAVTKGRTGGRPHGAGPGSAAGPEARGWGGDGRADLPAVGEAAELESYFKTQA